MKTALGMILLMASCIRQLPVPTPTPPPPTCPEGKVTYCDNVSGANLPSDCWCGDPLPDLPPIVKECEPPLVKGDTGECVEPLPEPPPPPPPPADSFIWQESSDADVCVQATVGNSDLGISGQAPPPQFLADVEALTRDVPLQPGDTELGWYARLGPACKARGLHCAMYGEELAVARERGMSENYDRLLANGKPRTGLGSFRSRCFPATASMMLPEPVDGPASAYPAPVAQVRIKVHIEAAKRADGLAIMDGVALACGPNADFPGRQCWPACGPEGSEGRETCDLAIVPRWEGGAKPHKSNPWLHHAKPGNKVRACVGSVCSDWVVAK